jgi:hypothetical protein
MKEDLLYKRLKNKMHEVSALPTQELGMFTPYYKKIVPQLKFYPWRLAILISIITGFILYFTFGSLLVRLVSILQIGF